MSNTIDYEASAQVTAEVSPVRIAEAHLSTQGPLHDLRRRRLLIAAAALATGSPHALKSANGFPQSRS